MAKIGLGVSFESIMNPELEKFVEQTFKNPGAAIDFGSGRNFDVACMKCLGWDTLGIDLPNHDLNDYQSIGKVDLIYSNYVIQFIKNKNIFIDSCFDNLKKGGYIFIQTFSKKDKIFEKEGMNKEEIGTLLRKRGFDGIKIEEKSIFDNEPRHRHWHRVLIVTAQKPKL